MLSSTIRRSGRLGVKVVSLAAAAALVFVPWSGAAVDVPAEADVQFDGAAAGDHAGSALSSAGDVNGDGTPDVLIAAPEANSVYVVFADPLVETVDLNSLGTHGYRIHGAPARSVANAGDVNGDGAPDALIGAPLAGSGTAYVVFGKSTTTQVDLASLGGQGYRIAGGALSGEAGASVANAGDVNEDGRPDAVVGAPAARLAAEGTFNRGAAFVVFGKTTTDAVQLDTLGANGYRLDGANFGDRTGEAVTGAGDVDGDGAADVLVGAPNAPYPFPSGVTYLVLGKSDTTTVDLALLENTEGFRIRGNFSYGHRSGSSVAAEDVNGDGVPDALIGSNDNDAWVVFGVATPPYTDVDLTALGTRGYQIPESFNSFNATTVSAAGDMDDDGLGDVLVGTTAVTGNQTVFVSFGRQSLAQPSAKPLSIDGAEKAASSGDVNGDGRPDVVVAAPFADNNGRTDAGSAYIVYGRPTNDDFGDVQNLFGVVGALAANTAGATKEPLESDHGAPGGSSVWYAWPAPVSGRATFDACNSDFDTVLAAYSGTGLGNLTPVAADDDSCGTQSRITFDAVQGTWYFIAAAGKAGATGWLDLNWRLAPANDLFAAATPLSGSSGRIQGTTVGADREPGEPIHGGDPGVVRFGIGGPPRFRARRHSRRAKATSTRSWPSTRARRLVH